MAKVYYTEQETATKLGVGAADLANFVRDGKLRSFQDGARKMYKVEEVDALVAGKSGESGEITLAPAEGGAELSDADKPRTPGKEDTVITAEGISIFDDEDLEIEAADPMAKTQIAPSLDEQVSVEGVGSGSGLLDLTRESDDTSLGAEVLDHIDMEGQVGSSLGGEDVTTQPQYGQQTESMAAAMPVFVEVSDAGTGAFNGMVVGSAIVMLVITAVGLGMLSGVDALAEVLRENLAVLGGAFVVAVAATVIGYMTGKSAAIRQAAMGRVS